MKPPKNSVKLRFFEQTIFFLSPLAKWSLCQKSIHSQDSKYNQDLLGVGVEFAITIKVTLKK